MADEMTFGDGFNQLFPINSGAIRFKVKGNHCAFWLVTKEPYRIIYKIQISNYGPSINCCKQNFITFFQTNPSLSSDSFQSYWLSWYNGRVRIGHAELFLDFEAPYKDDHDQIGYIQFNKPDNDANRYEWKIEVPPRSLMEMHPKQIDCGKLHWVKMIGDKLPPDALIGGFENEPTYIARAFHNNSLCPGRYIPSQRVALIPWGFRVHKKQQDFEVLCGYDAEWIKTTNNNIPENAFIAGNSEVRNEPLYIGRAMIDGNILTGKVHVLYKSCYLPYKNQEISVSSYELLVLPNVRLRGSYT